MTSRDIDWYINKSILRGSGGGVQGGSENFGGVLQDFTGALSRNITYIIGILIYYWHRVV